MDGDSTHSIVLDITKVWYAKSSNVHTQELVYQPTIDQIFKKILRHINKIFPIP